MSVESDQLAKAVANADVETATKLLGDTWSKGGSCAVHDLVKSATLNKENYSTVGYSITLDPPAGRETVNVYSQTNTFAGSSRPIAGITEVPCNR